MSGGMTSASRGASSKIPDPVEVLHLDAHTGHVCVFSDPTCCPEYDDALDVLDVLERAGYRIVPNGEHLLHQEEDSWAMEHTVECRQRGLMECALHELACSGAWKGVAPGAYRLVDLPGQPVRLEEWP